MSTNAYAGARSGGKVVNRRRWRFSKSTPYDRPPSPPASESPNWLTGVVLPATRTIVSGAAKFLSSVFDSSSDSSSVSDSSSPSDSHSIDEDEVNDNHENVLLEETECGATDAEHCEGASKSKRLIEKLLMRETFSRAECDKFINIINSRTMSSPTPDYALQGAITPHGTSGTIDPCTKAISEAKEWLKIKKSELHPDWDYSPRSLVTEKMEKEHGSPINVARSYMECRPPWASPYDEYHPRTPSQKKSVLLASGSWNISEEIRRVRSKATDDLLHPKQQIATLIDDSVPSLETRVGDDVDDGEVAVKCEFLTEATLEVPNNNSEMS